MCHKKRKGQPVFQCVQPRHTETSADLEILEGMCNTQRLGRLFVRCLVTQEISSPLHDDDVINDRKLGEDDVGRCVSSSDLSRIRCVSSSDLSQIR